MVCYILSGSSKKDFFQHMYKCSFPYFLLDSFLKTNVLKIYVFCNLLFPPLMICHQHLFMSVHADFLFTYCPIAWMYDLFPLIPIDGRLDSFQYFSVTEKAAVNNILVHVPLCLYLMFLWD